MIIRLCGRGPGRVTNRFFTFKKMVIRKFGREIVKEFGKRLTIFKKRSFRNFAGHPLGSPLLSTAMLLSNRRRSLEWR